MPALSKKLLRGLKDLTSPDNSVFTESAASEATGNETESDDDGWGLTAASRSSDPPRSADSGAELSPESFYEPAASILDEERVKTHKTRLLTAIRAEYLQDVQEHLNRLHGDREELIASGRLVVGFNIDIYGYNCFTLTKTGGNSFRKTFRTGDMVTIYVDDEQAQPASTGTNPADLGCAGHGAGSVKECDESKISSDNPADGRDGKAALAPVGGAAPDETKCTNDPKGSDSSDGNGGSSSSDPDVNDEDNIMALRLACLSKDVDAAMRKLQARRNEMGVDKVFGGCVMSISDEGGNSEMVVRTRDDGAAKEIEEANKDSASWALTLAVQDTTFRRQIAAADDLNKLISKGDDVRPGRLLRRADEVRIRNLILCDPDDRRDSECAQALSGQTVAWMDPEAQQDLDAVLLSESCGLNGEQLGILRKAARRSLTLMQGPPGTGKTRTLAAIGAGLCQVFHNPLGVRGPDCKLPTDKNMEDWSVEEVASWIQSFPHEDLKQAASKSLAGCTGRKLKHSHLSSFTAWFREDDDDGHSQRFKRAGGHKRAAGSSAASDMAKRFLELRDTALAAISARQLTCGYRRTGGRDMRIILCADTNTAVDGLLEGLVAQLPGASAYEIVRMGIVKEGEKGDTAAWKYHVDHRREQHPLAQVVKVFQAGMNTGSDRRGGGFDPSRRLTSARVEELQNEVRKYIEDKRHQAERSDRPLVRREWLELADEVEDELLPKIKDRLLDYLEAGDEDYREDARRALKALGNEMFQLALTDILISAQVVVGTNTGIGEMRAVADKHNIAFPIVIVDEAGQSSEPSSLIPLTLGAEWVLMGGDLKQLPPTIKTKEAQRLLGYDTPMGGSQYGRFAALGVCELGLCCQYRMHPAIREFPSAAFYGGHLKEDPQRMPDMAVPKPTGLFRWPLTKRRWEEYPMMFFDVDGVAEERLGLSYLNKKEARMALRLMLAMGRDPSVRSIAVLTPYKAQADYLRKCLDAGEQRLAQMQAEGTFHPTSYTCHTVDGFQGHEADVVVVSTVRSNGGGRLGHVADVRRLNVAVTRARRALLLVGSGRTLRAARHGPDGTANQWARLLRHMESRADGAVLAPWETIRVKNQLGELPHEMTTCVP